MRLLIVVVAVAATLRLAGPLFEVSPGWIYQATPARADALAIGCIAALVPAPRRGGFVALALIVASFFFVRMQYYGLLTLGMTVFAVASATAIGGARGGVLRAGVLGYFGRRSYGLYLYHWPIFMAADRLALEPAFRWGMKIALPVLAAEASFWLVERKALALKRRLGFDRRTIASSDRAVPASSGGE